MKLPLSDLIDRYSIELRKDYYGHGNPEMIAELKKEITRCLGPVIISMIRYDSGDIDTDKAFSLIHCSILLGLRNADIANSEWQIRAKQDLSLEEIGRRAILTRTLNDARSDAKQEMSKALAQNVETRHFGFGEDIQHKDLTLDVQSPAETRAKGRGPQGNGTSDTTDGYLHTRRFF